MSWLDEEEILHLREVYNKEHKNEKPIAKGSTEKIWSELTDRLRAKCKSGRAECIIASMMSRPRAPKEWAINRNEWLSSDDIDAVENNYEEMFPDYFFVGCVPIDFDLKNETNQCIVSALCKMKIENLVKKGKHKIGIVFNTDPHDASGQHWIALFADMSPELEYPRITYFDSYARHPEKEIQTLMRRWKQQYDELKLHSQPTKLTYNKTRHQYKDSECGMYCLFFHYSCLMKLPMDKQIPDDVINSFRNFLFKIPKIE